MEDPTHPRHWLPLTAEAAPPQGQAWPVRDKMERAFVERRGGGVKVESVLGGIKKGINEYLTTPFPQNKPPRALSGGLRARYQERVRERKKKKKERG